MVPEAASGGGGGGSEAAGGGRKRRRAKARNDQKQDEGPNEEASMEEVSEYVETFLSGLTEAFGFDGEVSVVEDDGGLIGRVEGRHGLMVGPKGRTLDAIQELARVAAQRTMPNNVRIKVDVGGYREMRREALEEFARSSADEALREGKEIALEPMSSADRKVVHDALNAIDGIETRSDGAEPNRRVVIVPDADAEGSDADDSADDDGDELGGVETNGADGEVSGDEVDDTDQASVG